MNLRRSLLKDIIIVETSLGEGAYGRRFSNPITVKVGLDQERRLVRSASGAEVISECTIISHPKPRNEHTGHLLDAIALFTPESKITLNGRVATVISVSSNTFRGKATFTKVTIT